MMYFRDCKNIEDVKEAFKRYAKELHPDNGGDAEEFKRMMQAYTAACKRFKGVHREQGTAGKAAAGNAAQDAHRAQDDDFSAEMFADIIAKVVVMDGVDVEIVGSWIWLSGNTYFFKDRIKAAGFMWSSKHKKWYYNGSTKKSKKHSKMSFEQVRDLHGSRDIKSSRRPNLCFT